MSNDKERGSAGKALAGQAVGPACMIVVRNPSTGRLLTITEDDGETIATWDDEAQAALAAKDIPICRAWPWKIVEAP